MFKFFSPFTGELHVAAKKVLIPQNIQTGEPVEQKPFDLILNGKGPRFNRERPLLNGEGPMLRRRNAFSGESSPPMFFSIIDNRLRSGDFDLTHHTNTDLMQAKKTIIHV